MSGYPIRQFDYALVYNCVDGDTVDIETDLGFSVKVRHRFRLARINTPERGAAGWAEATAALRAKVQGKVCTIQSEKLDKYGRYLAEIIVDGENINDYLVVNGFAVKYG